MSVISDTEPKLRIEQWGTVSRGSAYDAPEVAGLYVVGEYYCPERKRVRSIQTSRIVDAEGRRVLTRSGSVYELGEPHPDFLETIKGRPFDPENPIKVRR